MGETALHKAVSAGAAFGLVEKWIGSMRAIISHKADVNIRDVAGETALMRSLAVQGTTADRDGDGAVRCVSVLSMRLGFLST